MERQLMPYYEVTYLVEGDSISDVLGRFAYPDGEDRTDNVLTVLVSEYVEDED
jgi:hypothetical protein